MRPEHVVLDPEEAVLWDGRPRIMAALPNLLVGVGIAVAGVVLAVTAEVTALLTLVPVGLAIAVWGVAVVQRTRYVVSAVALYKKTGVFSRSVRRMRLERVQNSTFSQGVAGRLFGYGAVRVEAAGGGRIAFTDVEGARDLRALVERHAGRDEIPGTKEQWEAVLAEAKRIRGGFERRSHQRREEHGG